GFVARHILVQSRVVCHAVPHVTRPARAATDYRQARDRGGPGYVSRPTKAPYIVSRRRTERAAPFGRCGRRSLAKVRFVRRCGRPERAATAGRGSVRQELFGLCPRSDERACPEVRRALASRVEPTEYTQHVLPCA